MGAEGSEVVKKCTYEKCTNDAIWLFATQEEPTGAVSVDHFCFNHAMSLLVFYASLSQNEFKPLLIQAHPIRLADNFPVCMFVCSVGHIGRVFIREMKDEEAKYALVGEYRRCKHCDTYATDIMKKTDKLFGGKGKITFKKYDKIDVDVA